MGKATNFDDTIRSLSLVEVAARHEAVAIADDDVEVTLHGQLVKKPTQAVTPRVVAQLPQATTD